MDMAVHLNNRIENELVQVAEIKGCVSNDLYGAFREWELIAEQSNATKAFYSLSISPDPQQRNWTQAEWGKAISHIEKTLDLTGQPRAIVYHEKIDESDGELRKHAHIVWSRIDGHTLKAIPNSNDYYKLRRATKELAKEFGLELRYAKDKIKAKEQNYDFAKSHGKNRDVETSAERKKTLTKLWREHDERAAFILAAKEAGYIIAQGDRRSFVAVDTDGQIHSLARQIQGVKTKDVKTRLGDPNEYLNVEQAKAQQRQRLSQENRTQKAVTQKRLDLSKEMKLMAKLKRMAHRVDKLKDKRQRVLTEKQKEAFARHAQERDWLERRHRAKTAKAIRQRSLKAPTGLIKHMRTAIGYELLLSWKHAQQDRDRIKFHVQEKASLLEAQTNELARLNRQKRLVRLQEAREAQRLERLSKKLAIRKEKLAQMHERGRKQARIKEVIYEVSSYENANETRILRQKSRSSQYDLRL